MTESLENLTSTNRHLLERILFSPDELRLRSGWRILGQAVLFEIFAAISMDFLFPLLPEGGWYLLLKSMIWLLVVTFSIYLARRFLDLRSFVNLGLTWKERSPRDLLAGFLMGGFSVTLLFLTYWWMGWLRIEGFGWQVEPWSSFVYGVVILFLIFIMTAWTEELQARGYWLQNLEDGLNLPIAFILSALLYSLLHITNPGYSWMAFMGLLVGGFALAYGYIVTRKLWLPMGLHLGWNFFKSLVFGFQQSGLEDMPKFILRGINGPELWTGGGFGPEAGLLMMVAMGVNVCLIYIYSRTIKVSGRDLH